MDTKKASDKIIAWFEKYPKVKNAVAWCLNKLARFAALFMVLCLIITMGCGTEHHNYRSIPLDLAVRQELVEKYDTYLSLSVSHQEADGFIMTDGCDSLLFSSLYKVAGGNVDLTAADNDGRWSRRPLSLPDCYTSGGSASSISRDMFNGLFWGLWRSKDLNHAVELRDYGVSHNWIMGDGDISRTYLTPGLQATLAELTYRLGGANHDLDRKIPQIWTTNTDFAAHLDVLHIMLRGELIGNIDDNMLKLLKTYSQKNPENALFQYAYHRYSDGDQTVAANLLLDTKYFPEDHLPTTENYSTDYLYQRDMVKNGNPNPDWLPGGDGHEHSGVDFLFAAKLVLGE